MSAQNFLFRGTLEVGPKIFFSSKEAHQALKYLNKTLGFLDADQTKNASRFLWIFLDQTLLQKVPTAFTFVLHIILQGGLSLE